MFCWTRQDWKKKNLSKVTCRRYQKLEPLFKKPESKNQRHCSVSWVDLLRTPQPYTWQYFKLCWSIVILYVCFLVFLLTLFVFILYLNIFLCCSVGINVFYFILNNHNRITQLCTQHQPVPYWSANSVNRHVKLWKMVSWINTISVVIVVYI